VAIRSARVNGGAGGADDGPIVVTQYFERNQDYMEEFLLPR
jgi:hypothetical protein